MPIQEKLTWALKQDILLSLPLNGQSNFMSINFKNWKICFSGNVCFNFWHVGIFKRHLYMPQAIAIWSTISRPWLFPILIQMYYCLLVIFQEHYFLNHHGSWLIIDTVSMWIICLHTWPFVDNELQLFLPHCFNFLFHRINNWMIYYVKVYRWILNT